MSLLNSQQARLFLIAQAEMARVEGMKVANDVRRATGHESPAYDEDSFMTAAARIEQLAHDLIQY